MNVIKQIIGNLFFRYNEYREGRRQWELSWKGPAEKTFYNRNDRVGKPR